jgi:hypothetical protein
MPRSSHTLARLVSRNLLIAIGVALPIALLSGLLAASLFPPQWAGASERLWTSSGDAVSGILFWYIILLVPTLLAASLHQLVLAALPHHWTLGATRLVILATTLGIGVLVGWRAIAGATSVNLPGLIGALLPALLAYGLLVRPLRPDAA